MLLEECVRPPAHFTRTERIIMRELLILEVVGRDRLVHQLYMDDPDGGPLAGKKIIDVFVNRLRKKIAPWLRIDTLWGYGFQLRAWWGDGMEEQKGGPAPAKERGTPNGLQDCGLPRLDAHR